MITVTKTFLPPQEEYNAILKCAWDTGWMTNRGILVKELEAKLKSVLNFPNIIAMTNGTLPLQVAIKALGLTGEIITTPFSYIATTSSIVWEGCTPVFVDIHPEYLTIDETQIEAAITERTTAILATHVYGNPCNVDAIQAIAIRHKLKVIYDGAHCFGVTYKSQSIFNYGDVSTCSFHATKLFHTGEGGALFFKDSKMYDTYFSHHNFGHKGREDFQGLGINAKMSEPQAALGLAILPYMAEIMETRKQLVEFYIKELNETNLKYLQVRPGTNWNYSYFPVIFEHENQLIKVKNTIEEQQIYPRRYFYPSLNTLSFVNYTSCPISESTAKTILCLPLYHDLTRANVKNITALIISQL